MAAVADLPATPLAKGAEALVVRLARGGDADAFAELVRRRQSWVRTLMRRLSGDTDLADDLAQQTFLQAWRGIARLRRPDHVGAWLKRLAVNTWLQHLRRHDALRDADALDDFDDPAPATNGLALDLDQALATLPAAARLCIVLSYMDGMSHGEIAAVTGLPPGTVKSHIRRGTQRLQTRLAAYRPPSTSEATP